MQEQKLIPPDISALSEEVIEILLFDTSTDPSLFDEIARKNTHRPGILRHLLNHPLTPHSTREFVAQILSLPVPQETEIKPVPEIEKETFKQLKIQGLLQKIQKLKTGEKIQLALRGSRNVRTILLRDTNKEVVLAVLESPKITESEIELLAKQQTTSLEIIRAIVQKGEWVKNYSIVHALVSNPKTPIGIALRHIHALRLKDLSLLEKNKNIPEAVRATAKKLVTARKR